MSTNQDVMRLVNLEDAFRDEADENVNIIVNAIDSDPTLFARLLLEAKRCPATRNAYKEILDIAAERWAKAQLADEQSEQA